MEKYKTTANFAVKKVVNDNILVPVGAQILRNNILVSLNESALVMYNCISHGADIQQIADALLEEYNVSADTAMGDASKFVELMLSIDAIEVV